MTVTEDGSVRTVDSNGQPVSALDTSLTPEIFYDGQWYPICGHYFWDGNTNAATTLCKQLGFASGTPTKTETKNSKNAMPVGRCNENEPLTACTGGGNAKYHAVEVSNKQTL